MHIGYIISRYPGVSHTFIQREVLGLRKLGYAITTISIRPAAERELLTETDRAEARRTHVMLPPSVPVLAASVVVACRSPKRLFAAARCAWGLRRPGLRGWLWTLFYFVEALLVHRLCRREGIQHLHAHFANVASDVAMIASVLNEGTFSYTMHGPTEFFEVSQYKLPEKTRAAKFVICISDFARSQLMSMVPPGEWGKFPVVHCGVDPEQFRDQRVASKGGVRANILCVARMVTVKGHAVLLRSVAELVNRGLDVQLTLAGDGPMRAELERMARELGIGSRVRFLGNVGQDVIHRHYASADVFALPSFAEGVPVVLMEAMAAGCPVVATRIAGISELIEDGRNGLIVSAGRVDLLADAIERILLNPRAAERMATAAEETIRQEFNLNTVAPQLAGIFKRTLEPQSVAVDARSRGAEVVEVERSPRRDVRDRVSAREEVKP